MYFPAKYSMMWLGAGQGHDHLSLFLVFLPWVYLLLTQTEAKLTGFKADLPCSPLGEGLYSTSPLQAFHLWTHKLQGWTGWWQGFSRSLLVFILSFWEV